MRYKTEKIALKFIYNNFITIKHMLKKVFLKNK